MMQSVDSFRISLMIAVVYTFCMAPSKGAESSSTAAGSNSASSDAAEHSTSGSGSASANAAGSKTTDGPTTIEQPTTSTGQPNLNITNHPGEVKKVTSKFRKIRKKLRKLKKFSAEKMTSVAPADEDQERGNWSSPVESFLTCLGYAVGLGNMWRFPYLCYRNGGGAFLIPYLISLFLCGMPLMLMEMTIGQYSSQGPLSIWAISPLFKGVGISMLIVSFICNIYYCLITAWALYYLFMSIRAKLPWSCCEYDTWASDFCVAAAKACPAQSNHSSIVMGLINVTNTSSWVKHVKFSADDYFHRNVLAISDGLTNLGSVQWPLLLALFIAWLVIFLVLMKGIKTLGKAVYFSSTFPYLLLLIMLIRAAIEPGAAAGIKFYLTPKWEKLLEARVWGDAVGQVFYSTGACFGSSITLASYNTFRFNVYRLALTVSIGNSITSIFSGFVVFSILGFMANSLGVSVAEVVTSGPGLTFITYPQAVSMLPVSPLWSCLFFVMLVNLALSSMFPMTENITTALIDQFWQLRPYKFYVTGALCFVMFLLGILLTTQGGVYILQILDSYAVGYSILILGLVEVCVVTLRYGGRRLMADLATMLEHTVCKGWLVIWCFVTPTLLFFAIIVIIWNQQLLTYGDYVYPQWSNALGWVLVVIVLCPVPIYAIIKFVLHKRSEKGRDMSIWQSLVYLTTATPKYHQNATKFLNLAAFQKKLKEGI